MKTFMYILGLAAVVGSVPLPQESDSDQEYLYDDYNQDGDTGPAPPRLPDPADLLALLGDAAKGFMDLIQRKDFQDRVGETAELGLNVAGQAVQIGAPIAVNAIQTAPRLITAGGQIIRNVLENESVRQAGSAVVRSGAVVAGTVADQGPRLVAGGTRLAGSIGTAAGQTLPLVVKGLQDFSEQIPFFVSFGSAYVNQNAKTILKATDTFGRSFRCDFNCKNLSGLEKDTCEAENCSAEELYNVVE